MKRKLQGADLLQTRFTKNQIENYIISSVSVTIAGPKPWVICWGKNGQFPGFCFLLVQDGLYQGFFEKQGYFIIQNELETEYILLNLLSVQDLVR